MPAIISRTQCNEDEIRVLNEAQMALIAVKRLRARGQFARRALLVKAAVQQIEQRRLFVGRKLRLVLDRVGNAADEIRITHRVAELAAQQANAESERTRDGREDLSAKRLRAL
jgi:hypothetical protein